jgi:drug/metabolite transporter (DMT)-like permease
VELGTRIGEIAALGTAVCWCVSTLLFEVAGRRIGSLAVNLIRLVPAFLCLCAYGALVRGTVIPTDVSAEAWMYLIVSGWIGFVLGDMCLFRAFVLLGGRLSSLVMSLWPSLAALLSWAVLGESLGGWDVLGMTATIFGVGLAVADRTPPTVGGPSIELGRGLLLAFGGALGQAGGLVLAKIGMGDTDPFGATQIRVMAAIVGFAVVFVAIGWWPHVRAGLRDRRAVWYASIGAVFGPFLGVGLSLFAVQHTSTGVGASIMATTPILLIPAVVVLRKERVGAVAVAGTVIAVGGVASLFML